MTIKDNNKTTTLLLIRHGESEANRQKIFAGNTDVDLVDKGIQQAKITAKYIAETYSVDKIYSSDLLRAYRTAECISAETGSEIIKEPGLREIFAGDWEGKKFAQLLSLFPDDFRVWNENIGKTICTNGESVESLGERVLSTLKKIATSNIGKTIVISTHATPIRVTETLISTESLDYMVNIPFVSNASVTEIHFKNGQFELVKIGEDSHLKTLKTNSLV